jgi:hypothetical protein
MRHFIPHRPSLVLAGLLVVMVACSDTAPISAPDDAGTARGQTAGAPGDTALSNTPFTPATEIALRVTVGAAAPGTDTLAYTPLANVQVTVYGTTLVHGTGGGSDTLMVSERAVASATTDAGGKVRFTGLPAAQYRVEAVRSAGGAASVNIAPPYAGDVGVLLIIRP